MNTILTSRGEAPEKIPASAVKSAWGRVRDLVLRTGAVVITTRERESLIMLSVDEFHRLCRQPSDAALDALERSFRERVARMQGADAHEVADAVFDLDPREFTRAAIKSVKEREQKKRNQSRGSKEPAG